MTPITLESIKTEQTRLAEMIAAFEKQAEESVLFFPEITINLQPGEQYAGIIVGKDGEPSHQLILLPEQHGCTTWKKASEWATQQGGSLPTRREQSLLFANLKDQFEKDWYWSSESYEPDTAYAWFQSFHYGRQYGTRKDTYHCRARAVRRVEIKGGQG